MYKFLIAVIALLPLWSCKKVEEKAAVQTITTGHWIVTSYIKGSTDVTTSFAPYEFQFQANNTVDAYRSGSIEKTGTWIADVNSKTITSEFTSTSETLMLLNGTWNITNSTWTSVDATETVNNEVRVLKLLKK